MFLRVLKSDFVFIFFLYSHFYTAEIITDYPVGKWVEEKKRKKKAFIYLLIYLGVYYSMSILCCHPEQKVHCWPPSLRFSVSSLENAIANIVSILEWNKKARNGLKNMGVSK